MQNFLGYYWYMQINLLRTMSSKWCRQTNSWFSFLLAYFLEIEESQRQEQPFHL